MRNTNSPTLYTIQNQSTVNETLQSLPLYNEEVPKSDEEKEAAKVAFLYRHVPLWSMACENNKITRQELAESIQTLSTQTEPLVIRSAYPSSITIMVLSSLALVVAFLYQGEKMYNQKSYVKASLVFIMLLNIGIMVQTSLDIENIRKG
jgi:hypothetical protein